METSIIYDFLVARLVKNLDARGRNISDNVVLDYGPGAAHVNALAIDATVAHDAEVIESIADDLNICIRKI